MATIEYDSDAHLAGAHRAVVDASHIYCRLLCQAVLIHAHHSVLAWVDARLAGGGRVIRGRVGIVERVDHMK